MTSSIDEKRSQRININSIWEIILCTLCSPFLIYNKLIRNKVIRNTVHAISDKCFSTRHIKCRDEYRGKGNQEKYHKEGDIIYITKRAEAHSDQVRNKPFLCRGWAQGTVGSCCDAIPTGPLLFTLESPGKSENLDLIHSFLMTFPLILWCIFSRPVLYRDNISRCSCIRHLFFFLLACAIGYRNYLWL